MTPAEVALVMQTVIALTLLALLAREWRRQDREDGDD